MNDYLQTKELYHHGVKGMKWGIIKEDYQMHKRAKNTKKEGTAKGAVIGGLLGTAAGIGSTYLLGKGHIFSKNSKGKLVDKMTGQKYSSVVKQSRKRTIGLTFLGAYMGAKIGKYAAGKSSAKQNLKDVRYQSLSDNQRAQIIKNNVLGHSGIKGQKWGIRRFQNEDGTLTEAGKARYNQDGSRKNPEKMSDTELANANRRLGAESQYRQLTGTTQPGRSINRDTAIKIGATFVSTAAATFLLRKYKKDTWLGGERLKDGTFGSDKAGLLRKKKAIGSAFATAALAGGIGALIAGTSSLGGSARPESKKDDN